MSSQVGGDLPSGCCPDFDTSALELVLESGLGYIVDALDTIDATLEDMLKGPCDDIAECMDEIIAAIDLHYKHATSTCDDCKAELHAGMGGTVEYAVRCAGACIEEEAKVCTLGDPSTWGKPCKGCGRDPCCCNKGTCEPCEEAPKQKYRGYCNPLTGSVIVVKSDQAPPDPAMIPGAEADTEEVAFEETARVCGVTPPRPYQPGPPPYIPETPSGGGEFCDIRVYQSGLETSFICGADAGGAVLETGITITKRIRELGFEGLNLGSISDVIRGVQTIVSGEPYTITSEYIPHVANLLSCGSKDFVHCAGVLATVATAKRLIELDLSEYAMPYRYAMHKSCRQTQLTPTQAGDAYLADAIDESLLDTHFAIAGICPESVGWYVQAVKSKPEPAQLVMMRHRGLIDANVYHAGFRQLGYLTEDVPDDIYAISEHLPDIATVARMLQQGAADPNAVEKFGLDREADKLESGDYARYLRGNGISERTAELFWRAHWTTPNVASLFEFYHRLRNRPEFGGADKMLEDIRQAFDTLGITPYWQKHLEAVILQPLLKRDIRAAYTSGALVDENLETALQLTGHDDAAVATIARELKPARRHAMQSHLAVRNWIHQIIDGPTCRGELAADGFPDAAITQAMTDAEPGFLHSSWSEAFVKGLMQAEQLVGYLTDHGVSDAGARKIAAVLSFRIVDHQAARDYMAGTISRDDASQAMLAQGMRQTIVDKLLHDADHSIDNSFALECVRGIKDRYLKGEVSNTEAGSYLSQRGIPNDRVNRIVSYFDCQKRADGTAVHVEKLCHWLYLGTINPVQFLERLLRLGYSPVNAELLLADCLQANTLRQIREAKAVVKEQNAILSKAASERAKLDAQKQRAVARLAAGKKRQAKLRADRDRQQLSAAEKLYKSTGVGLAGALLATKDAIGRTQSVFGLSLDEALQTVLLASEKFPKGDIGLWPQFVDELAEAAESSANEPTLVDVGAVPSSNGDTHPSGPTSPLP